MTSPKIKIKPKIFMTLSRLNLSKNHKTQTGLIKPKIKDIPANKVIPNKIIKMASFMAQN
jgi:hypothetical protein